MGHRPNEPHAVGLDPSVHRIRQLAIVVVQVTVGKTAQATDEQPRVPALERVEREPDLREAELEHFLAERREELKPEVVVLVLGAHRRGMNVLVERGAIPAEERHGVPGQMNVGEPTEHEAPIVLDGPLERGRDGIGRLVAPDRPVDGVDLAELLRLLQPTDLEAGRAGPSERVGHGARIGGPYLTRPPKEERAQRRTRRSARFVS